MRGGSDERKDAEETEKYVYIEPIGCRVKHRFKTKTNYCGVPSFHE
ncbi:hypothetical protein [Bacillus haynesii]